MKPRRVSIQPVANDAEGSALADVIYQSFAGFGLAPDRTRAWLELVGRENLRFVKQDGRIVAGLGMLPFGQWFGGRSVPSAGVTTVAVLPEVRGSGIGGGMMRAFIRELHDRGIPLSVLYPSTKALYRKAGYEPAGLRLDHRIEAGGIGAADRRLEVRPLMEADHPAVKAIYGESARHGSGRLDRRDGQWERILRFGIDPIFSYGVFDGDGLAGYLVYTQHGNSPGPYEIRLRDVAARSMAGWQRILAFLGDHVFMAGPITFQGGPAEPLIRAAREEQVAITFRQCWMIRVVDVQAALAARGYASALTTDLKFEIEDDLIAENNSAFMVRIEDGRARVRKIARAALKMNIRGLASLYTGHLSAFDLKSLGLMDGPESDLELASATFAGPAPAMNDRF